jgi:phosphoglycolate phosphatase-like HAD superfamily hydrolase
LGHYVKRYGEIVKEKVVKADAVKGSIEFLKANHRKYNFAIVSGADELELRDVCKIRGLYDYFDIILGAPLGKRENIVKLFNQLPWDRSSCAFVGDSINDYDAAEAESIFFIGRNSGLDDWSTKYLPYISDLSQLTDELSRQFEKKYHS